MPQILLSSQYFGSARTFRLSKLDFIRERSRRTEVLWGKKYLRHPMICPRKFPHTEVSVKWFCLSLFCGSSNMKDRIKKVSGCILFLLQFYIENWELIYNFNHLSLVAYATGQQHQAPVAVVVEVVKAVVANSHQHNELCLFFRLVIF
jgi:hypothetical protein